MARAGEWDRATTREVLPHQDRRVAEIIDHDDFFGPTVLNDIALLILEEPFKLTSIVDTVCLPRQDDKYDFSQCVASGWGKENFSKFIFDALENILHVSFVKYLYYQHHINQLWLGLCFQIQRKNR